MIDIHLIELYFHLTVYRRAGSRLAEPAEDVCIELGGGSGGMLVGGLAFGLEVD